MNFTPTPFRGLQTTSPVSMMGSSRLGRENQSVIWSPAERATGVSTKAPPVLMSRMVSVENKSGVVTVTLIEQGFLGCSLRSLSRKSSKADKILRCCSSDAVSTKTKISVSNSISRACRSDGPDPVTELVKVPPFRHHYVPIIDFCNPRAIWRKMDGTKGGPLRDWPAGAFGQSTTRED